MRVISFFICILFSFSGVYGEKPFSKNQSEIYGMLISETGKGTLVGGASRMNATVIQEGGEKLSMGFNQETGEMMSGATQEVLKYLSVRYQAKNMGGYRIEFGYSDKYSPKDGPSAAVACMMMADSIVSGKEIDPKFAVTGDMTATGAVQPVGGIESKIDAAIDKGCKIVGIPYKNIDAVSDLLLGEGVKPIHQIQIFSLESFDDAAKIGYLDRSEKFIEAIKEFEQVQLAMNNNENNYKHPKVVEKLQKIVNLAPNHESAKILLLHAYGKAPTKLSVTASMRKVSEIDVQLSQLIKSKNWLDTSLDSDELKVFINDFNKYKKLLDDRTYPYAKSLHGFARFARKVRKVRSWNDSLEREKNKLVGKMDSERERLQNNESIQEELMRQ